MDINDLTMIKRIALAFGLAVIALVSCGKTEPENNGDNGSTTFTISGVVIPETIECQNGQDYDIKVVGSNGPKLGDKVVLEGSETFTIDVKSVQSGSFTFTVPDNIYSGDYTFSIQRGTAIKRLGKTTLVVSSGIEIDPAGANVYGQVSAQGKGVKGVAVSDGAEVVLTDENGIYRFTSKKYHKYVFISVPSGYEPVSNGILPTIHKQLTKDADTPERADFSLIPVSGQNHSTVLMLGDMHLANRTDDRKQFADFVKDINEFVSSHTANPIYAITLGDMTWDLYWEVNNYGYREYLQDANTIKGLKIYHTIGNHDHSMYEFGDYNTVKLYKQMIAPTYYSFNIGNVHYIVLDDVECTNSKTTTDEKGNPCYERSYNAKIVQEQFDWMKKDLANVSKSTPLVITMHIPLYNEDGSYRPTASNATTFEGIIAGYSQVHLYTAHTHRIYNVKSNNIYEHNAGAVCGTWWWSAKETPGVHIGPDGSPAGYTVLNVNGETFSWEFKATGSPSAYQFRTYDRNKMEISTEKYVYAASAENQKKFEPGLWSSKNTDNEVYLNVWNYDDGWTIDVKENGKSLDVTRVNIKDPLHLVAYTAKRLNSNKDASFATEKSKHLFKVIAASATSTLEITVKDQFGHSYTETMKRPKEFSTDIYKK